MNILPVNFLSGGCQLLRTFSRISFLHYVGPKDPFFPRFQETEFALHRNTRSARDHCLAYNCFVLSFWPLATRAIGISIETQISSTFFTWPHEQLGIESTHEKRQELSAWNAQTFFCCCFVSSFLALISHGPCASPNKSKWHFRKKKEVGNFHRETFCSESRQQQKSIDTCCVVNGQIYVFVVGLRTKEWHKYSGKKKFWHAPTWAECA